MKKLLIVVTLSAAALAATPLLAQQKPQPAAGDCPMAAEQGGRGEHRAEMHKRMQEQHGRMGAHEGRGRHHGHGQDEQEHRH